MAHAIFQAASGVMYLSHSAALTRGMASLITGVAIILADCKLEGQKAAIACAALMALGFTVFTKIASAFDTIAWTK